MCFACPQKGAVPSEADVFWGHQPASPVPYLCHEDGTESSWVQSLRSKARYCGMLRKGASKDVGV
jgi:hypothetical protein